MKLHEIPKGSRIKTETFEYNTVEPDNHDHDRKLGDFIIFHYIDGAFSYCTVEGLEDKVCHLSVSQELKWNEEGYYELVANQDQV